MSGKTNKYHFHIVFAFTKKALPALQQYSRQYWTELQVYITEYSSADITTACQSVHICLCWEAVETFILKKQEVLLKLEEPVWYL